MLICLDVDYRPDGSARPAAALFHDWPDSAAAHELVVWVEEVEAYEPGQFSRRELPCLLAALEQARRIAPLGTVIIDGYVTLDADGRPGLGTYLWQALDQTLPVIGVAKTAFAGSPHALALRRGRSARPLYITSAGLDPQDAREAVGRMAGDHRLPTLLKRVDFLCRHAP